MKKYTSIVLNKLHKISFKHIQIAFWTLFILVPLFSGLLAYHWLPNESFESTKDTELVEGTKCTDDGRCSVEIWQDNETGKIYSREMFKWHNKEEAQRMSVVWFLYGLIGCLFYAFTCKLRGKNFYERIGIAMLIDLGLALYTWITMLN